MRVLHLLASRGAGGAEVLVRDLAIELRQRDIEVGIAFISRAADLGGSPEFESRYQEELERASIPAFDLGHDCRRNPLTGAVRLSRTLERYRPDILHIHLEYGLLFRLLLWPARIPTVYTHHIDRFRRGRALFRLLSLTADRFIAISRQTDNLLRTVAGDRVTRIVNAVSFNTSSALRRKRKGAVVVQVLSVGGLYPQKNYSRHLRMVAALLKRRPDLARKVRFLIAGDGPERAGLERQVTKQGLASVVSLLGIRSDVHDLMLRSDLLLMTSDYEGLPITLIEALHAGLPIVATDVGGCAEVVDHGTNGFLARVEDEGPLGDYLLRLIDHAELRALFAKEARQKARSFSIEENAERHLALYCELLGRGAR